MQRFTLTMILVLLASPALGGTSSGGNQDDYLNASSPNPLPSPGVASLVVAGLAAIYATRKRQK